MGKKIVYWAVLMVSVLLNLFLARRGYERTDEDVRVDTLVVRDTVRIVEPIHIKETVVRYDTVWFERYPLRPSDSSSLKGDSAEPSDSIEVMVPITQKVYEDSLYKAVVRGYNPELVSLDIYRQQTTVYRQQTRKPKVVVSAGVYGGFGVKGADYGLGISVGVPIWSW